LAVALLVSTMLQAQSRDAAISSAAPSVRNLIPYGSAAGCLGQERTRDLQIAN
jgi:hypothetical protein